MGIQGLYDFIRKKVAINDSKCITKCTLKSLAQIDVSKKKRLRPRIAFDSNAFCYKFLYGNRPDTHIIQFGWLAVDVIMNGMEPIFIFDGEHPELKKEENERRRQEKKKFIENISETQEQIKKRKLEYGFDPNMSIDKVDFESLTQEKKMYFEEIQRLEDHLDNDYGSRIILTPQHIEEVKEILRYLGIWVIQAPSEGEALASLLNRLEVVDYVAADDADVFPFGAKKVIRDIGWRGKREDKMMLYDVDLIRENMGIDQKQMIEICTLCINDYNKSCRIENMGFNNSFKAIKEYRTIEAFIHAKQSEKKRKTSKPFVVPDGFNYKAIRKIFEEVAFADDVPEEIKKGNPYIFDMKKASYFLYRKNMNFYLNDLQEWAKILEKRDYTPEELEEYIRQEKELADFDQVMVTKSSYKEVEESEIFVTVNAKVHVDDEIL